MEHTLQRLRINVTKCRDLAGSAMTPAAREVLSDLALQYEQEVLTLETADSLHHHRRPAFKWPLA